MRSPRTRGRPPAADGERPPTPARTAAIPGKKRWITMTAIGLTVVCPEKNRLLQIVVTFDPAMLLGGAGVDQPGGLLAIALESDATLPAPVFGAHAHDVVGRFDRLSECEGACEAYADAWLARTRELAPCDCTTIGCARPHAE